MRVRETNTCLWVYIFRKSCYNQVPEKPYIYKEGIS